MSQFVDTVAVLLDKQTICKREREIETLMELLLAPMNRVRVLSFLNVHAVMRAMHDKDFLNALLKSDVVLRDGIGMEALMQRTGRAPGLNMNGTDFIPRLIGQTSRDAKLALLGTREPRLSDAAERLRTMGFKKVISADGFQPDEFYVELVQAEVPRLVVLAMGMPKQERVALRLAEDEVSANQNILVVNGGGILDFLSGGVTRAPGWMRRAGLEWLYRFWREPIRLLPRVCESFAFALLAQIHGATIRKTMLEIDKRNPP